MIRRNRFLGHSFPAHCYPQFWSLTQKGEVEASFENIEIEPTRVYDIEDARSFLSGHGVDVDSLAPQVEGKFRSAFIRAAKPKGK